MKRLIAVLCLTILLSSFNYANAAENLDFAPYIQISNISCDKMIERHNGKIFTSEYPNATFIWNYLKDLGYSNYVCSGIIGNMMVEAGGCTLTIEENASTRSYYGICQWSRRYYPDVIGTSLDIQCDYLRDTIEYELNTFGCCYSRGFNYESFLTLENEQSVALAFAKCYERCSSASYKSRQECATAAYNYFTNLEEVSY